jgi:hypothetical protein
LPQLDDGDETLRWYELRARYFTAARRSLENDLATAPVSDSTRELAKEITSISQEQSDCAEHLGLTKVLRQVKAESPYVGDPTECWEEGLGESVNVVRYALVGSAASVTVDYRGIEQIGTLGRFFAVLLLSGAVFVIGLGIRHGMWTTLLLERPYAVGIALGLVWWRWLWPSFLGLAIAAFFLIAWWRARRQQSMEAKPTPISS